MATKPKLGRTPPAGFQLQKYAAFKPATGQSHEQLTKLWCDALFFRQTIYKSIQDGKVEEMRALVEQLVNDPTYSGGFSTEYVGAGHIEVSSVPKHSVTQSYSQGTAWATRGVDLVCLEGKGGQRILADNEYIDDALFDNSEEVVRPRAFVTISLLANDSQIRKDFSRWLTAIRLTRGVRAPTKEGPADLVKKWSRYGVLPFIDLFHLWGPTHSVKFQRLQVAKWATANMSASSLKNFADGTLPRAIELALDPRMLSYLATSKLN